MDKKEQLDLFPYMDNNFELSEVDILQHKSRMNKEVSNKSGAIHRLVKARYDDMLAKKIAEENLLLRKKVKLLQDELLDLKCHSA